MQKIYCGSHGVIKKDNKFLLGIRNKKTSGSSGKYFTIGGTLEFFETTESCLHREVKEEANIEIENVKFFKHYDYLNTDKKIAPHRIVFIYTADYKSGKLKGGDDCIDPQFFSKSEVLDLISNNKLAYFPMQVLRDLGEI